jgi:hypothetical protein
MKVIVPYFSAFVNPLIMLTLQVISILGQKPDMEVIHLYVSFHACSYTKLKMKLIFNFHLFSFPVNKTNKNNLICQVVNEWVKMTDAKS